MKTIASLIFALAILSGCASSSPAYVSQKQSNREAIEKIRNVEIFYHADDAYGVFDGGGSGLSGLGGLFGPIGALIAASADAGSKMSVVSRAEARSKEFTKLVQESYPGQDLNTEFTNKLAELVRASGRQVKLTRIPRPTGAVLTLKNSVKDMAASENYSPLVLRITTGYGAESATSSYKPLVVAEYGLWRDAEALLLQDKDTRRDGDNTYMTFQGLLEDHKAARDTLSKEINAAAVQAYKSMFDFSEAKLK